MGRVKAMVIPEVGKLQMMEFDKPSAPEDGALLRVSACGICGTDKHMMAGKARGITFPAIPGHEFVGVVEELGPRANQSMAVVGGSLKEGDRIAVAPSSLPCGRCWFCLNMPHRPSLCSTRMVYGLRGCSDPPYLFGGFAEYVVLHGKSWAFKIPEGMPDEVAALVEPASVALRAVERAYSPGEPFSGQGFGAGKTVMVIGAGPIGTLAVAVLRYLGAGIIIVSDMFEERMKLAKKMGADVLVDGKLPLEEKISLVNDAASGVGPDVVIEAAGHPKAFEEALAFVRRGGKLIEVGHYTDTGSAEIHPFYVCQKDVDIHGSWSYPPSIFKDALYFLGKTTSPVSDLISHKVSLESLGEGLNLAGTASAQKIMVVMD